MGEEKMCSECGGAMEAGFVPDVTYGAAVASHWHPGVPEEKTFVGIPSGVRVQSEALVPIHAYRCTKCFLVRMYAPPRAPRKG